MEEEVILGHQLQAVPKSFVLDRAGSLTSWTPTPGLELLHPYGGGPVSVPVYGDQPEGMDTYIAEYCNLPQHGLVQYMEGGPTIQPFGHDVSGKWYDDRFSFLHTANETFDFDFGTEVVVREQHASDHIIFSMRTVCGDQKPMPISSAFRPHFATYGGVFEVQVGKEICPSHSLQLGQANFFTLTAENREVKITLDHGVVILNAHGHFDEVCVWSDNPNEYICVELIGGRKTFGDYTALLFQDRSLSASCEMLFIN